MPESPPSAEPPAESPATESLATEPPGTGSASTELKKVRDCLHEVSTTLAMRFGDRISLKDGGALVELSLDASARRAFEGGKLDQFRQAVNGALGRSVKIKVVTSGEGSRNPAGSEGTPAHPAQQPRAQQSSGDGSPPPIVARAVEIFHGSLRGGGQVPPPRR